MCFRGAGARKRAGRPAIVKTSGFTCCLLPFEQSMLLTITTTHQPATDLGYLLAKNPARAQTFDLAFGQAHVVYPEARAVRCTAALLLDVDPVGLVRGR